MCDDKKSGEKVFRERFHARGLLNRSKSSSSSSCGNDDSLSFPLSPQTSCLMDMLKPTPAPQSKLDVTFADEAVCDTAVSTPICGTPSVSQRKSLLGIKRKSIPELSPNLKRLISTPGLKRVKSAIKDKLDSSQLAKSFSLQSENGSPGLARLRLTPGKPLKDKRQVLVDKHNETRRNADVLNIGGGVSLWPGMEDMRLSRREFIQLCLLSVVLVISTCYAFQAIHGGTLSTIEQLCSDVDLFNSEHSIKLNSSLLLKTTSLDWHRDFDKLISRIQGSFLIVADGGIPYTFYICSSLYVTGIGVLLYYLLDNMMSTGKLSPNRIKKWVCLLVIIGTWTINSVRLVSGAFLLEQSVEERIYDLSEQQKLLAYQTFNTQTYDHVVGYWSVKYLPPSSQGVLSLLGIIQFKTLIYYMQYYSVPILTALISPIIKLVIAVLHVYGLVERSDQSL